MKDSHQIPESIGGSAAGAGSPIVPFAEAALEQISATFSGKTITFPDGRRVRVGVSDTGSRDRVVCFNSPTSDGQMSELKFGLRGDAADALLHLLQSAWNEENTQPQPTHAE